MSVISFVTAHYDDIIAIGGLVGGLIWHRSRKSTMDDLWDTLLQLGRQAVPKLLEDTRLTDDAYVRSKINAALWNGLERLKVPRTKTIEKLVDEAVEHIHGELASKLMDMLLGKYIAVSEKTIAKLNEATSS